MTTVRILLFWGLTVCILVLASAVFPAQEVLSIGSAALLTLLLTVVFARWERVPLVSLGVVPQAASLRPFGAGLLIGARLVLFQEMVLGLSGVASLTFRGAIPAAIISKLVLYSLVAWREELAFRGYPLRRLVDSNGIPYAFTVLAALFSLEHVWGGMAWWQALFGIGVAALLFMTAAIRTGGIAMPLGIHLIWNFGQWAFGQKDGKGIWQWNILPGNEPAAEQWGYAAYFVAYGLAIVWLWKYPRR